MKKSPFISTSVFVLGVLSSSAAVIGPWPATNAFMWKTDPFTPVCGTVAVLTPTTTPPGPAQGLLQMSGFTTGSKIVSWLPFSLLDAAYSERMCVAHFYASSTGFTNIHAKIFDPLIVGKSGFAVILKDDAGRIFDFGCRGYFASAQIRGREFDGFSWTIPSSYTERVRTGNDYYTMDFTNNFDGTISWTLAAEQNLGAPIISSGTSTVAYGPIVEVYLNVMTKDSTGAANYKWTEFSTEPAVMSPPPLYIAPTTPDITLFWPSPWTTAPVVEQTPDLASPSWSTVTGTPIDDGTFITLTVPNEGTEKTFRLKQ